MSNDTLMALARGDRALGMSCPPLKTLLTSAFLTSPRRQAFASDGPITAMVSIPAGW